MDINSNRDLPSETIQKEFENNPLIILKSIRNEEENNLNQLKVQKVEEKTKRHKDIKIKDMNFTSPNNGKKNLEEEKNDKKVNFELMKNKKDIHKGLNNKKNTSSNKNFINYNSKINYNKNKNIIVNNFNIFFNFDDNCINLNDNNNNFDSNNINKIVNNLNNNYNNHSMNNNYLINSKCKNESIFCMNNTNNGNCKNGKIFCNNNTIIDLDKINIINNNENKLLLTNNIDKLLNNLKSYKGSIISQSFIDIIENEEDLAIFFKSLIPHICQIMCLDYGNYFFQKLIKKLNFEQRFNIYQIIEPEFLVIATNKCGTHSIQSLMDSIQSPLELSALNKLISKNMLLLFIDDNAYHIMMKMILDFPEEKRNVLNIFLVMNIEKIIINVNGAFCVNKFITNNKNLNLRKLLVDNLKNNIKKLLFNKYSCINLLLVLTTFGVKWGNFIIKEIEENFVVLSENPISSVFIMKVLDYLKNSRNLIILKILISSLYKNIVLMNFLISNKNNSKILNKLIEYSDMEQKKYLFVLLKQSNW